MNFTQIIGKVTVLENYIFGGVREFRQVILSSGEDKFTLPVTPSKYSVTTSQNNKVVDILDFGEHLIFGNEKLMKLKVSCFFPAQKHAYPFVVGDKKEPAECVELMNNWRTAKTPVRIIITDSPVNLIMSIDTFVYKEKDGTRDVYFDLNLTEYRDFNVPSANFNKQVDTRTGLKMRPGTIPLDLQKKLVGRGLDIADKAKSAYGNFSSVGKFQSANGLSGLSLGGKSSWSW